MRKTNYVLLEKERDEQVAKIPYGAKYLKCDFHDDYSIQLNFEHIEDAEARDVEFCILMGGDTIPENFEYVGTAIKPYHGISIENDLPVFILQEAYHIYERA